MITPAQTKHIQLVVDKYNDATLTLLEIAERSRGSGRRFTYAAITLALGLALLVAFPVWATGVVLEVNRE